MSREEAIKLAMKACEKTWNEKTCKQIRDALEQEPSGDLVSRQAVLDIVDSYSESQSNVEDVTQDIISDIMICGSRMVEPQESEDKECTKKI